MNAATYGVKHKDTGLFFAGFDAKTNEVRWGAENDAERMERQIAQLQAALFVSQGINAQRKAVTL